MLRIIVPEGLERAFFQIARQAPTELNWFVFSALLIAYFVAFAAIARSVLLRVDAELIFRTRVQGKEPPSLYFAIGLIGYRLPHFAIGFAAIALSVESALALDRLELFAIPVQLTENMSAFAHRLWRG